MAVFGKFCSIFPPDGGVPPECTRKPDLGRLLGALKSRFPEDRRWERYPSAHDIVTIEGETEQHTAIVLNTSPSGMGLKMAGSTGLARGQIITINGSSGPIQTAIRHITAAGIGSLYLGVEWCESTPMKAKHEAIIAGRR